MLKAESLRNKSVLTGIPGDNPGYYKWWATKDDFELLLDKLGVGFEDVAEDVEKKDGLYCIYVGIAAKESVRKRLDWHVNDTHSASKVKYGTLSTLRQSISSLLFQNQYEKDGTDEFINGLYIEYFTLDNPIKTAEAEKKLLEIESSYMKNNLYILNIQGNHHPKAKTILSVLSSMRAASVNSLL